MYHFNDHFYPDTTIEDMPSLNIDPKINSTISDNPYRSNVEIEKDEVILQPDLSALFMAKGKHIRMEVLMYHYVQTLLYSQMINLYHLEKETIVI